jgi:hypothetical protein
MAAGLLLLLPLAVEARHGGGGLGGQRWPRQWRHMMPGAVEVACAVGGTRGRAQWRVSLIETAAVEDGRDGGQGRVARVGDCGQASVVVVGGGGAIQRV